jgi:hypothetical protein
VSVVQYETRLLRRDEQYCAILFQLPLHHSNLTANFTIFPVSATALFTPSSLNFMRLKLFAFALKARYYQVRDIISHCVHHYEFYRVSEEEMSIFWEVKLKVTQNKNCICIGVLISPYPDLLNSLFCLMVRIFRSMIVLLYIYI